MRDSIIKGKLRKIFIALFWILIWQLVHQIIGRELYVPSPLSVFKALMEMIDEYSFWITVYQSLLRVLIGILLSTIFGVILGIVGGVNELAFDLLSPLVSIIKATPVISFIIIALIWFSSSMVPVFICFLMCFPIVFTNIVTGIRNVDEKLLQMARVFNVKRNTIIRFIYLPSLRPYFQAAIITCLGLGWKVSVAAEVLSYPRHAIGSNLYSAKVYLDVPSLFAWTFVVVILSIIFEVIFVKGIKKRFNTEKV